jgi:hypothetical protein
MLHDAAREALTDPNDRFHPGALHGYGDDREAAIARAACAIALDERDDPGTTGNARFVVLPEAGASVALGAATLDGDVTVLRPNRLDRVRGVTTVRRLVGLGAIRLAGSNATTWVRPSATDKLADDYTELVEYDPTLALWAAEPVDEGNELAHTTLIGVGFTPYLKPDRFDVGEGVPSPEMQLYTLPSRVK